MTQPELSLIIPAYNEARRLPGSLQALRQFAPSLGCHWEAIVIVEQSHDETLQLARDHAATDPHLRVIDTGSHLGKGAAVRRGMLEARGDIRLFMDADLSVPLEEIPRFLDHLRRHPATDLLIGSRKHPDSRILRQQGWLRRRMGETFNTLLQWMIGIPLSDTQCGFKAFRAPAAKVLFSRATIDGFAFDVEVLLLAQRLGLQMGELSVQWINSPDSHVRILHDSATMLRDTIRLRRALSRDF